MFQFGLVGMGVVLGLIVFIVNFFIYKIEEGQYDLLMKYGFLLL